MKLTQDRLAAVIINGDRHDNYIETVKIADHCQFHIDGYEYDWYGEKKMEFDFKKINFLSYSGNIWFDILIGENRPEESKDSAAYTYRMKTYKPITKSTVSQVLTEFQKITRSSDWQVKFSDDAPMGENTLKEYFLNYPVWGDFTNFVQMVLVKMICMDPNALAVVIPTYMDDDSKLPDPVVKFYGSRYVLDYSQKEYAICYEHKKDTYCVYTRNNYVEYKKQTDGNDTRLVEVMRVDYSMELKTFNAKKLKGVYKSSDEKSVLYDSFVSPMLPYLDKAARESSDLDASTVRAMFPQAWQWAGMSCTHCNGGGKVPQLGNNVVCPKCNGIGSVAHSPSQVITVKADRFSPDQQLPIPPKGFIEPSTGIIELQRKSIAEHKYDALASLNFHFLDRTPLNESGKAKEVDQDSLHNSIQKMAENLVENARWIASATNELRYMALVASTRSSMSAIEKMLPKIPVPEDFSIITAEAYLEELKAAKDSGVSVSTKREIELQYIEKRWRNNEEEKARCKAYVLLNPGYGMDAGQISLSNDMDVLDKIVSINIIAFVDRAIEENENFLEMERTQQMEVLYQYAEEKMPSPAEMGLNDNGDPVEAGAAQINS